MSLLSTVEFGDILIAKIYDSNRTYYGPSYLEVKYEDTKDCNHSNTFNGTIIKGSDTSWKEGKYMKCWNIEHFEEIKPKIDIKDILQSLDRLIDKRVSDESLKIKTKS